MTQKEDLVLKKFIVLWEKLGAHNENIIWALGGIWMKDE